MMRRQAALGNVSTISSSGLSASGMKNRLRHYRTSHKPTTFFPPSPLGLYALGCGSQNLQSFSTINENRHHHQTRYARSTRCRYAAPPSCLLLGGNTSFWREAIFRFLAWRFLGAEEHPFGGGVQISQLPARKTKTQDGDRYFLRNDQITNVQLIL